MHSMWLNLNVKDLDRSEQFFKSLGFEINKNPEMLDKMLGITIGQTIVILIENNHFESVSHQDVDSSPNEVMVSLGVKENKDVDELLAKVEPAGGTIIEKPGVRQGYYLSLIHI